VCRLVALPLAPAADWLRFYEHHWEERLNALANLFRTDPAPDEPVLDTPAPDNQEEDR
jgi:hypothetical protein